MDSTSIQIYTQKRVQQNGTTTRFVHATTRPADNKEMPKTCLSM
jgi:hypothetical protein